MGASSGVELVSREFGLGYRLADSFAPKPPNCENENLPSPSGPWAGATELEIPPLSIAYEFLRGSPCHVCVYLPILDGV